MIEGYSDRMLRAPRFVRERNPLIPEPAFTVRLVNGSTDVEGASADAPAENK